MRFWYIVHVRANMEDKLVERLNKQDDIYAFIPKIEKWHSANGIKEYIIKDLYPDYVFIMSKLNKEDFYKQYEDFFLSLRNIAQVLDYENVYALNNEEQQLMEKLFNQGNIIRHSIGNIVDSKLIVDQGPLIDLENKVIKIDRHHRTATLQHALLGEKFTVPLEVMSKS